MISISVDVSQAKSFLARGRGEGGEQVGALMAWVRRFVKDGIESLLRAELSVVLERGDGNTRNGFRTRKLALSGIGDLVLSVPRDRKSAYRSALLPFRKRRTAELEELAAEMFLAGMSTRDVSRTVERHFGSKFDSKEISRMVAATSSEVDAWRTRALGATKYKFLYLDGANFSVRRGTIVERLAFLCVIGVRGVRRYLPGPFRALGSFEESGISLQGPRFIGSVLRQAGLSRSKVLWLDHEIGAGPLRGRRVELGPLTARSWALRASRS